MHNHHGTAVKLKHSHKLFRKLVLLLSVSKHVNLTKPNVWIEIHWIESPGLGPTL